MDLFQLSAGLSMDITPFQKALDDAKKAADNFTGYWDWKDYFVHPLDDVVDKVDDVDEAGKKTKNTFDDILAKIEKIGDKLFEVGANMEKFGFATERFFEPATKFGQNAIDTAIDYESAFTGVKKTVKGTKEEYDALSAGIKELSTTTASDKIEIAGVAEVVGQLTDKIENVLPITETAIKLGDTTVMSAGDAATQLTQLMNIMGASGDESEAYGSALVRLGNDMATDEKKILNMSLRIAGAGTTLGMTGDQVLALSAGLSSLGIRAEAGGSSISRVLLSMGEAAKNGLGPATDMLDKARDALIDMRVAAAQKSGLEVTAADFADMTVSMRDLQLMMENSPSDFRKLADAMGMTKSEVESLVDANVHLEEFADISGMTADEFSQAMQEDAYSALLAFLGGLGQLDEEGASAFSVLQGLDLNTIRVRDSLLRGAAGYEQMVSAAQMSNEAFSEASALEEEAAMRYGDTAVQIHQTKESFSNLVLEIGDRLLPMVEKALGFGDKVITFLDSLPDGMLETVATIGLVGGAIGKIITSIGGVVKAGGTIISLLGSLGPTGAIIAVVVAGAALIIANWDKIKEFFGNLASWFGERIETIKGELHDWAEYFRGIGDKIAAFWDEIKAGFIEAWEGIQTSWESVKEVFSTIGQFFSDAWGAAKTAVQKQLDDMVTAYESHDNKVEGILAAGWELMTSGWDAAWTFVNELTGGKLEEIAGAIGDWVSARIEAIGQFFSNMQEKVKSGLEAVKNFFTTGFNAVKQTITTFVTTAINKITEFVQNVKNKIEEFKKNIVEKFEKLKSDVVAKVTKIKDDAVEGFRTLVETVRTKISEFPGIVIGKIEEVTSFISGLPGEMLNWGRDMIQSFVNGITQTWDNIKNGVVGIADWVAGIFGHSHPDFGPMADDYKWMPDMMKSFARGIRDNRGLVLGEMQGLADDMAGTIGFAYGPAYTAPRTAPMTTGGGANGAAAQNDRPINITVQSVLDGRVIGETSYRYAQNRNYVLGRNYA